MKLNEENIMQLKKENYILGVWYAEKHGLGNWICTVKKGAEPNSWEGEYRFRYYKDGSIFDSKDERSFQCFMTKDLTEEQMKKKIEAVFEVIKMKYNDFDDYLDVRGDFMKMVEVSKNTTWMHIKIEEKQKN
jgi:hypothetical protein